MFTYYQLKVFCMAIEKGRLVAVAKELYISEPAVSQHIKSLEQHFGVRLLSRTSRGINLTDVGMKVYTYAQKALNDIAFLEEQIEIHKELNSNFAVGAGLTTGIYILPKIIRNFQKANPGVELKLKVDKADSLFEDIKNNKLDLIFSLIPKRPDGLEVMPVFHDKLVIVGSSETCLPITLGKESTIVNLTEQLSNLKVIYPPKSQTQLWYFIDGKLKDIWDKLDIPTDINNPEAAKKAVESGLGVALMFQCSILEELKTGVLRKLPIDLGPGVIFGFMWKRGRKLPKPLNCFMEYVHQNLIDTYNQSI